VTTPPIRGFWTDQFPGNFLWSNATLIMKGMAPYGVVAVEELDRACEQLKDRQGDAAAWWEVWSGLAEDIERRGEEASAAGHEMTAGNYFLRAGHYYSTGERFIQPGPEKRAMAEKAYKNWHAGIRRRFPKVEFLEIPYENTTLPALFLPAEGVDGPAPTVVIFNGMDNAKEMSIVFAGLEFSKRGFNTLAVDGPGQGENLRLRDLYSRYDYEVAGTAAYDYLLTRKESDPARVAVMGYSFGGYYSSRIASFEHRYAACVAFSALHWDLAAWQQNILDKLRSSPKAIGQSNFQFQWVVGAKTPEEAIEIAKKFSLDGVVQKMRCPFLVTHGGNDRIVPLPSAPKLYEACGSADKTIKIFTTEEGAAEHAHVDNRQVGIDYAADWLADRFAAVKTA
jgi:pimeloyl-ACP methyl ester carboxylesterase